MGYLFKSMKSGIFKPAGIVDIPFLGAKVGEFTSWSLTRRGDVGPDAGLYDLHAVFSFVSEALWNDPDYEKRILINLSPHKQYRLERDPSMRMDLEGRGLLIEGVTIHATNRER